MLIENDGVRQTDALLRLFFSIEPDNLEDEKWGELSGQLWWSLKATGKVEMTEDGSYRFIK